MKKIIVSFLAVLISAMPLCLSGCGKAEAKTVYIAASNASDLEMLERAAKLYKEETGKNVEVKTETDQKAKDLSENKATVFEIGTTEEFEDLKDYCADIENTTLNSYLPDKRLALRSDDGKKTYAVPFSISGFGIVYNKKIFDKYYDLKKGDMKYKTVGEVKDFKTLKSLTEEIQKNKKELGIDAAFASPSLKSEDAFKWHSRLLNQPLYFEFSSNDDYFNPDRAFYNAKEIDLRYDKEYKDILDLIKENSNDPAAFETKSNEDSISEFKSGRAAMILADDDLWGRMKKIGTDKTEEFEVGFLPLYMDASGDKKQGITINRERFFAINKKADKESREAADEFLSWLFSSSSGKKIITESAGILTPFNTFAENELPEDPLKRETARYLGDNTLENAIMVISEPIKQTTKAVSSLAISGYMTGKRAFDDTKNTLKDVWKKATR